MKRHKITKKTSENKGFTLIELLVVIAIIGLLASIVMVSLSSARADARDVKRITDLKGISDALELYYSNNNGYVSLPSSTFTLSTDSAWQTTLATALSPYIKLPQPPNYPNNYVYGIITAPPAKVISSTNSPPCIYLINGYYLFTHNEKLKPGGLTYTDGGVSDITYERFGGDYQILTGSGGGPSCP